MTDRPSLLDAVAQAFRDHGLAAAITGVIGGSLAVAASVTRKALTNEAMLARLEHELVTERERFDKQRAEAAVAQKDFATAIADYKIIVAAQPDAQRYLIGLVMAHNGQKDYASALALLNQALAKRPTAGAHYARALTYFNMGNRAASLQDLNIALSAEPNNPAYRHLERQLSGAAPKAQR